MNRRAEIIEKVIPLISSIPFDDIGIVDICAAAGISSGTFYHYFDKKSDLLVGLLGLIDDYMAEEAFPHLKAEDEIENLKLFAHYWATYVSTHGLERSKLITSAVPSAIYVSGQQRIIYPVLIDIFARGQEKGQICQVHDAETLAEFFLLAIRSVTVDWSRNNGNYSVTQRMDDYINFFLRALRP